jgi:hypothetical protein
MLDAYLDLPTQQSAGPELARSGYAPQKALAGRAVFARLEWNQGGGSGSARLQADALDSARSFSRTIQIGSAGSTETVALPIPSDAPVDQYRLSLVMSGGPATLLGRFQVGHSYQAEDMGGVIAGDSGGWTIVGGAAYQGGVAARSTVLGSTTHQAIPPIDAGSICVGALVYDDGSSRSNLLEITLGGAGARLAWSGSVPGMRWIRSPITLDRAAGRLGTRLIERGQAAALVDAVEVYPLVEGGCSSG